MRILGVDPGLKTTGFGIVEVDGSRMRLIDAGCIEPKRTAVLPERLFKIHKGLAQIISEQKPDYLVLEKLYAHYKHPTTASILGHARGVICLLCAEHKLPLIEHSVKRIRKSVVGNGNATKEQTQRQVIHILGIRTRHLTLDTSDALALALGHAQMMRGLIAQELLTSL